MSTIGENVRYLRTLRGLTQHELATRVSLGGRHHPTASYISLVESGRRDPRASVVRSIARALHVKPWVLLADITENVRFWDSYLSLSGSDKREIQRIIDLKREQRGNRAH